jgi:hypothetical protein
MPTVPHYGTVGFAFVVEESINQSAGATAGRGEVCEPFMTMA